MHRSVDEEHNQTAIHGTYEPIITHVIMFFFGVTGFVKIMNNYIVFLNLSM